MCKARGILWLLVGVWSDKLVLKSGALCAFFGKVVPSFGRTGFSQAVREAPMVDERKTCWIAVAEVQIFGESDSI